MTQETHTNDLLELLARVADGVYAVDSQQRIIRWNQGAQEILGYAPEEVLGMHCFELLRGHDEEGCLACQQNCPVIQLIRKGAVVPPRTLRVPTKGGEARWVSITHVVVPSEQAELGALVHIFRDTTQETEAKRLVQHLATFLTSQPQEITRGGEADAPLEEGILLTHRERVVLSLLARGFGTQAIARLLAISRTTTRNHIQNILSKLSVHTRLEAVAYAVHHGILQ